MTRCEARPLSIPLAALLAAVLTLAGCGDSRGPTSPLDETPAATHPRQFPLARGAQWSYRVRFEERTDRLDSQGLATIDRIRHAGSFTLRVADEAVLSDAARRFSLETVFRIDSLMVSRYREGLDTLPAQDTTCLLTTGLDTLLWHHGRPTYHSLVFAGDTLWYELGGIRRYLMSSVSPQAIDARLFSYPGFAPALSFRRDAGDQNYLIADPAAFSGQMALDSAGVTRLEAFSRDGGFGSPGVERWLEYSRRGFTPGATAQ